MRFIRFDQQHVRASTPANKRLTQALLFGTALLLSACGGSHIESHRLGGSVTGLSGTGLVLGTDSGQTIAVQSNGSFVFPQPLAQGAAYGVSVKSQPSSPAQICTVGNGSGTMGGADVSSIQVVCSNDAFAVGGSVSGLTGAGLLVQNNAVDDLVIRADGPFTFPAKVASGAAYAVTVKTQPGSPAQTCSVTRAAGLVVDRDIADVAIVCATDAFPVGGRVSGLAATGLVLQNNAGDELPVTADGAFSFQTPVASGAAYSVTVKSQPVGQVCSVTAGSGAVAGAAVDDVRVTCSAQAFTVGGVLAGMAGSGLVLQNNGADDLAVSGNGTFTFATPVAFGAAYDVTVRVLPTLQVCTVSNGSGTATAAVTNVSIICTSSEAQVATLAGTGVAGSDDGPGAGATFGTPFGVAMDASGNTYVADREGNRIRKVTRFGDVTTFAGSGAVGADDGPGPSATFKSPQGIAVDGAGTVYVADSFNYLIRKISPAGVVSTLAGSGFQGYADGQGAAASFREPFALTVDAGGNVYVADRQNNSIRKITPSGDVTTLAGSGVAGMADGVGAAASFNGPEGIAMDNAGNFYVADFFNHRIRKITPSGEVSTFAGSGLSGATDGPASSATFSGPSGIVLDSSGTLYVADTENNKIRKITQAGLVSTYAGSGAYGRTDGPASTATFYWPYGLALSPFGNLVVADMGNKVLRTITPP